MAKDNLTEQQSKELLKKFSLETKTKIQSGRSEYDLERLIKNLKKK